MQGSLAIIIKYYNNALKTGGLKPTKRKTTPTP